MAQTLKLFGVPLLLNAGAQVALNRRKAMALLSYLAVTQTRHHRDVLLALLWPEANPAAASQALRNVLWTIRQTPLGESLHSDRTSIELDVSGLDVDVLRFRELLRDCPSNTHGPVGVCPSCEPLLEVAGGLCRGTFMSGFSVLNASQFEDWQLAEAEALRHEYVMLLHRLVVFHLSTQNWRSAAEKARKWLQVDSLNETAYQTLMQALSAQGHRAEALGVFDDCRRALSAGLGLDPNEITADLAHEIRTKRTAQMAIHRASSRLPSASCPIIGRDEIAKRIERAVVTDSASMVSLVGQGGMGKTSLALHVGRRLEHRFADGAAYVQFDTRSETASLATAIGNALGLSLAGQEADTLNARLAELLADRHMLLILDGVERFVTQVSELAEALNSAPYIRLMLTSRVSTASGRELVIPVQGLAYPQQDAGFDEVSSCASVRLLQACAEKYGVPLRMDRDEVGGMGKVARLLEGSPLGLEMAAGWRPLLDWNAIAARVSDNIEFLVHRCVNVAPRHRAMSAVFAQSWESLPDAEQETLRRLSVFRGTFTIRAAEMVARANPGSLAVLVNRCLLKRVGPGHFEMHELLRQFARRQLELHPQEVESTSALHVQHYTWAMEQWLELLKGSSQVMALAQMEQEIGNVHHAFHAAARAGSSMQLRSFCEGLYSYYDMRSLLAEACEVFGIALELYRMSGDRDGIVEAFMHVVSGYFVMWDRPSIGRRRIAEGVDMLPEGASSDRLHALATVICVWIAWAEDLDSSRVAISDTLEYYRTEGDQWGEALALTASAMLERRHDNLDLSMPLGQESLRLYRELGSRWGEGIVMHMLARLNDLNDEFELALARYETAQRLLEPFTRDGFDELSSLILQARVNGQLGRHQVQKDLAERALRLGRLGGYRYQIARALCELAGAVRSLGDPGSARDCLEEAVELVRHHQWRNLQVKYSLLLAELALDANDVGTAQKWLQEVAMLDADHAQLRSLSNKLSKLTSRGTVGQVMQEDQNCPPESGT